MGHHARPSDEHTDANIALIEWLENLDDVDGVYHNMAASWEVG